MVSEPDKPSQMEIARTYIGAFIGGALVAAVPVGVIAFVSAPADRNVILTATLVAGAVGGLAAASIPPVRRWMARVTRVILHVFPM